MRTLPVSGAARCICVLAVLSSAALVGCGSDDDTTPVVVTPEEVRPQDGRAFAAAALSNTTVYPDYQAGANGVASFTPLAGFESSSRWAGTLAGAAYRVEVPANWNGKLVMYTHGFRGNVPTLTVGNPPIRRYLLEQGYAWAASSYSSNYYDVRAGIEDTNMLALAFPAIASSAGRPLAAPSKIFITGHSMGGHIAAAAVEAETMARARNKVSYAGSVPMCGVTGDLELFNTFGAMQVAAQTVAGFPKQPLDRWSEIAPQVNAALWAQFPGPPIVATPVLGQRYLALLENLTGGERPLFELGVAFGGSLPASYGQFGKDGTIDGILTKGVVDTTRITYKIDGDAATSKTINDTAIDIVAAADANRLRSDGLRWIPQVNGEFSVPVVAIHTLGDLFVPFNMMEIYRQRAEAKGNGGRLVTRAIRGISHCDFTVAEQAEAFDAMVKWEAGGAKPAGDDVLTAATIASPTYGCTFTRAPVAGTDSSTVLTLRGIIAQAGATCPGS